MEKNVAWRAKEDGCAPKTSNWYWTVGIISVGAALSSIILGNTLLGVLIVLGGFTIMLAGTRPDRMHSYALSDAGVHIDAQIIPWNKIRAFAIHEEDEPVPALVIATDTLLGTTSIPLKDVDYRLIRTELKNRSIDEIDSLETITDNIARAIGL
ncbi:MAG: hypothetical protein ACJKTH_00765 [Patescibacteria group bacterium UBA2163]